MLGIPSYQLPSYQMMNRRDMISNSLKGAALLGVMGFPKLACAQARVPYPLAALPFAYDALEPHIDALTMEIHHSKHHQAYINNLNTAMADSPLLGIPIDELMVRIKEVPESIRQTVINNGGGHANHAFFWSILHKPGTWNEPDRSNAPTFYPAILAEFRSPGNLFELFDKSAMTVFGSGWAWLVVNADKKLEIMTTANQDSPLMVGKTPVMGLDVWEHAYYLKHQNLRGNYIRQFWSVVNWSAVEAHYVKAMG